MLIFLRKKCLYKSNRYLDPDKNEYSLVIVIHKYFNRRRYFSIFISDKIIIKKSQEYVFMSGFLPERGQETFLDFM